MSQTVNGANATCSRALPAPQASRFDGIVVITGTDIVWHSLIELAQVLLKWYIRDKKSIAMVEARVVLVVGDI